APPAPTWRTRPDDRDHPDCSLLACLGGRSRRRASGPLPRGRLPPALLDLCRRCGAILRPTRMVSVMSARSTVRALPTLFRIGFAEMVAFRAEMLVWVLATTMPLIMLALWSTVARDAPVGRFDQQDFVAYFLATFIVRQLTGAWVAWQLSFEVRTGTLAMRL